MDFVHVLIQSSYIFDFDMFLPESFGFGVKFRQLVANSDNVNCAISLFFVKIDRKELPSDVTILQAYYLIALNEGV